MVDFEVRPPPPAARMSRSATMRPIPAGMPLGLRTSGNAARLEPAILFSPATLGKTDDLRLGPAMGELGPLSLRTVGAGVVRDARSGGAPPADGAVVPASSSSEAGSDRRDLPATVALPGSEDLKAQALALRAVAEAAAAAGLGQAVTEEYERRGEFLQMAGQLLTSGVAETPRFGSEASDVSYDFDEYVLLRDVAMRAPVGSGPGNASASVDPRYAELLNEVRNGIADFLEFSMLPLQGIDLQIARSNFGTLQNILLSLWTYYCSVRVNNRLARFQRADIAQLSNGLSLQAYYGQSLKDYLSTFAAAEAREWLVSGGNVGLENELAQPFWQNVLTQVFQIYFTDNGVPEAAGPVADAGRYEFDPFPTDEALFGLRVIHRQTWHLMGYGRGELVKTIPLGPRESQKVSTRILRRRKVTRSSEEATSYETSQETGQTTKDTSEVVSEASEKIGKSLSAEVSGGYGPFFQARISGNLSQDTQQSSKETNSRLNEAMQKTASRMKRDTKVTVSSEFEETFEENRSSELTNPNDEVAITYLYHRLQQRHWVSTEVGEVHSVVFVPEGLPPQVDEAWVRQHADAIGGALLDQNFAGVLAAIRSEPEDLPRIAIANFQSALTAATNAVSSPTTYTGARDLPDLLASGQAAYERQVERDNIRDIDRDRRKYQSAALFDHIRRNILHYVRAIILDEDRDRRVQRLSRILVPTQWTFVPSGPVPPVGPAIPGEVAGEFVPQIFSVRPLSEIIDPTGPIGFLLNCAVYRIRSDPRLANLHGALAFLRSQYMRHVATVTRVNAAANLVVRQAIVHAPRTFSGSFAILYSAPRGLWLLRVPGRQEIDWPEIRPRAGDGALDVLGVMLWITGAPADRAELAVEVWATGELEDPHMKLIQMQFPMPLPQDESNVFTPELRLAMRETVPDLAGATGVTGAWNTLTPQQRDRFRRNYHRYLMLRDAGRLVTLDTANLILELEASRSPALEPFKRLHRYVDARSAYEENMRRSFENLRRGGLLGGNELADPEIERVTVLAGPKAADRFAVLPVAHAEGEEDE